MPQDVCSKLLHEPSIVRYLTPDPKCCMHGGLDRHAGNWMVWRVEWIERPTPVSIGVRLNLSTTQSVHYKKTKNQIVDYFYLRESWRVASMTRRASLANCWASAEGWTIFKWLKAAVFGWMRISFSINDSSKRIMSLIRLDAWLLSSSSCSLVMKRISNPVRLAIKLPCAIRQVIVRNF